MGNIKGTGFINCKEYLVKTYGIEHFNKVIQSLDPDDQAIFSKLILPAFWFDYGAYIRLLIAADRLLGKGDFEVVRQINYFTARKDVSGIYKILFHLLSPKYLMENAARLWRQFYDEGHMAVIKTEHNHTTLELTGDPHVPLYHEHEIMSYLAELLRMCDCKNVRGEHPTCIARDDKSCVIEMYYEA